MKKLATGMVAGGSALAGAAGAALAAPEGVYYGHEMMWGGGWFLGPVMMILWLALIVGAVVLVLRLLGYGPAKGASDNSIELLRQRFARGEIDKDEFKERMAALNS